MADKITVLLADDHALVRKGFRRMLEDDRAIQDAPSPLRIVRGFAPIPQQSQRHLLALDLAGMDIGLDVDDRPAAAAGLLRRHHRAGGDHERHFPT